MHKYLEFGVSIISQRLKLPLVMATLQVIKSISVSVLLLPALLLVNISDSGHFYVT